MDGEIAGSLCARMVFKVFCCLIVCIKFFFLDDSGVGIRDVRLLDSGFWGKDGMGNGPGVHYKCGEAICQSMRRRAGKYATLGIQ